MGLALFSLLLAWSGQLLGGVAPARRCDNAASSSCKRVNPTGIMLGEAGGYGAVARHAQCYHRQKYSVRWVMAEALVCWKCGGSLATLLLPFGRAEVCLACNADVRVCRMCVFFDPARSKQCRETVVDEVRDKERSNFCDYFKPKPGAHRAGDDAAARAREQLEKMFGGKT